MSNRRDDTVVNNPGVSPPSDKTVADGGADATVAAGLADALAKAGVAQPPAESLLKTIPDPATAAPTSAPKTVPPSMRNTPGSIKTPGPMLKKAPTAAPRAAGFDPSPKPRGDSGPIAAGAEVDPMLSSLVADRYRVLSQLGQGGMGVVYLAEHVFIEKRVALKVLSENFARKADLVQRFMQEARAASKIGHENIVDITDFGETSSGSVFFAMEFLEGSDLAGQIKKGPLDFVRARHIMVQLCRALAAAHAKGIVHRDLKPENIFLIEREGQRDFVKVLDFGIAKMSAVEDNDARLTRTGMLFGTPEYMSPEQAKGERPDHRVDVYAAGCILYEMLTGVVPFDAENFMGVLTKHMFEAPVPPSARQKGATISPALDAIVLRALHKDREQRFQSMKELAAALDECPVPTIGEDTLENSGLMDRRAMDPTLMAAPTIPPSAEFAAIVEGHGRLLRIGGIAAVGVAAALLLLLATGHKRSATEMTAPTLAQTSVAEAATETGRAVAPVAAQETELVRAPAAATVRNSNIVISSNPPGAEVFEKNKFVGQTPFFVGPSPGNHRIKLELRMHNFKKTEYVVDSHHWRDHTVKLEPVASVRKTSGLLPAPIAAPANAARASDGLHNAFPEK